MLPGICDQPLSANTLNRHAPAEPRFVLMTMTPLAASVPYKLEADGPRRTSMDSMMFGSMSSRREGASLGSSGEKPFGVAICADPTFVWDVAVVVCETKRTPSTTM